MPVKGSRRSTLELFWSKVDRTGPCWLWTASVDKDGYGVFSITLPADGRPARQHHTRGHRFAYELAHGPIPKGRLVMHSCDTPRCVNPAHLSLGTALDNNGDAAAKGRSCGGERNAWAKLTVDAVIDIRASSDHPRALAARYGVREETVVKAQRGITWRRLNRSRVTP